MTQTSVDTNRVRVAPALGLFVLAPLIGEFLLGNIPVTDLLVLPIEAALYGGGALLIRETARRRRLSWPSIILMALAYAIVEEGLVLQTLFNPDLLDLGLLHYGMGMWWPIYVLTIHTVWSIAVPIALVEALTPRARHSPWLNGPSVAVVAVVFLLGCWLNYGFIQSQYPYTLSPPQWTGALIVIVALVTAAMRRPGGTPPMSRRPPSLMTIGLTFFGLGSAFMGLLLAAVLFGGAIPGLAISGMISTGLPPWLDVAGLLAVLATGIVVLMTWSRRGGWDEGCRAAVAGGLVLVYAWYGITQQALADHPHVVDIAGNVALALGAASLAHIAVRRATARTDNVRT